MRRPWACLAALFVCSFAHAEPPPVRLVVVSGFNEAPDRPPLQYADDDAARLYELLAPGAELAALHVAFDRDSQALHSRFVGTARPPTLAALEATLTEVRRIAATARAAGRRSELFFFHAGHGDVEAGRGVTWVADGALDARFLERALFEGPDRADRVHVALDACKSYFVVAERGAGGVRATTVDLDFAGPRRRGGVGYLTATSNDADTHEWGAVGGGVFSHLLRSALLGGADADADAVVTYDELGAFMGAVTEGVVAGPYRPEVYVRAPPEDHRAPVPPLDAATFSPLELPPEAAGRVVVFDGRGLRWAETHKAPGAPLRLLLANGGRYEVQVAEEAYLVDAVGAPILLSSAHRSPAPALASRGEGARALSGLFRIPFSPDVVRGYRLGHRAADGLEAATRATVAPAPDPLAGPLLGGSVAALAAGGVLAALAAGAHGDAAEASQRRREELTERGNALTYGSVAAFGLGAAALGVLAWRMWDAP